MNNNVDILHNEADKLARSGEEGIKKSKDKFEECAKQYLLESNYFMAAQVYIDAAKIIVKHLPNEIEDAARLYIKASRAFSLDSDFFNAAENAKIAAEVLLNSKITKKNYDDIVKYYTTAKNQYGNGGYYSESGEMYKLEMHYRMLMFLNSTKFYPNKSLCSRLKDYIRGIVYFLAELFFGFGESIFRVALTSLLIVFLYGLAYWHLDYLIYNNNQIEIPNFGEHLYFSMVTFTTLGYGDITPNRVCFINKTHGINIPQ